MNVSVIPLPLVSADRTMEVVAIRGDHDVVRRLAEMGLVPGSRFKVIKPGFRGPLLIEVKGSRLGLGTGASQKIMAKEVSDE